MKFETAFTNAWGRPPTRAEVERVERVCAAFDVKDNDALKAICGLLEFYDGQFRLYPRLCADAVKRWLNSPEATASLLRAAPAPSSASEHPYPALASARRDELTGDARRELYWVTLAALATASSAVTGALGMVVGARLAGDRPCWVAADAAGSVLANLLGAPTGWVVFLALVVPAYYAANWGWQRGRDAQRVPRERWLGWMAFAGITASTLGWLILVGLVLS